MVNTSLTLSVLLIASFLHFLLYNQVQTEPQSSHKRIPALYVFGDSLVDAGNNNHLHVQVKNNFPPYGIDFAGHIPTGRVTNGKTVADYIALLLGLPLAPPYLGTSESGRSNITTGLNYASAGCGILPVTGHKNGYVCLSFDNQIEYFKNTVENDLRKQFKKQSKLTKHLSESLFLVTMGINDYFNSNASINVTPEAFAPFLFEQFSSRLKKLYNMGARKLLVNNLPPPGCFPIEIAKIKQKGVCNEERNEIVKFYNKNLPQILQKLQSQLPGATIVHSNYYKFLLELRANAEQYGITDVSSSCCPGPQHCDPDSVLCTRRDSYLFFDAAHPSQIANDMYVKRCVNDVAICSPLNLKQLIAL